MASGVVRCFIHAIFGHSLGPGVSTRAAIRAIILSIFSLSSLFPTADGVTEVCDEGREERQEDVAQEVDRHREAA